MSTSKQNPKAGPSSTLSSVVSSLVRAQIGTATLANVTDEDLDKHVASLILKEARKKEVRYQGKEGIRAYLGGNDAPKTTMNKRFLNTIIKSTDEHNKAIIKQQADATAEYRQAREREEKEERRRRAEEAVQARRPGRSERERYDDAMDWRDRRDSDNRRERDRDRRRRRDDSEESEDKRRRRRKHKSDKRHEDNEERSSKPKRRRNEGDEEEHDRHKRRRHRSRSRSNSRSKSPDRRRRDKDKRDGEGAEKRSSRKRKRTRSPSPERDTTSTKRRRDSLSPSQNPSQSITPLPTHTSHASPKIGPPTPPILSAPKAGRKGRTTNRENLSDVEDEFLDGNLTSDHLEYSSKMDRYFEKDYDPRLDVAPHLEKDGFLPENAFDQWNTMLEVLRLRREEKEEKKRLERLHGKGSSSGSKIQKATSGKTGLEDVFAIEYTRKGQVREWDEGKQEPF